MNRFIGFAIVSRQVEFVCATDNAAQTREILNEFAENTEWTEYTYTVEAVDEKCHDKVANEFYANTGENIPA